MDADYSGVMNSFAVALASSGGRGLDPNIVKPGWVALGIVALLCVAVFFLSRSFLKHSKKAEQPWEGENQHDKS